MRAARIALLSASAAMLAACGGPGIDPNARFVKGSSPIVGGTDDPGHPAVVLVYNQSGFLCTGTVIAPKVVLTAAHCTVQDDTCAQPNCTTLPASGYQVAGGENPINGADWVLNVSAVHTGPNYNGSTLQEGDVGILILSGNAPVTPMPYWDGSASGNPYSVTTQFTAVGYGINSGTDTQGTSAGTKRTTQLQVAGADAHVFQYNDISGSNTCSGDSGGPAIENINGVDTVVGTVSYGDQNCTQYGADMRTDDNVAFIGTYATSSNPTPTPTANPTATPDAKKDPVSQLKKQLGCDVAGLDGTAFGAVLGLLSVGAAAFARRRR